MLRLLNEATTFVVFTMLVVLVSAAYLPTTNQIISEWVYNGPYTHGFLALVLALWVVWQKHTLLSIETNPAIYPILLLLLGSFVWLAGVISNTFFLSVTGQFAVFVGSCWLVFGWSGLLTLLPAFGCMLLVLPIWGILQSPLQQMSILVTHIALDLIGIPTLKQGIFFTVPGGRFAVETGCSGLGFLLCSMLLAIVYSHFNNHSLSRAVRLFVFAIILALVANWVRIIIIMLVGNYTQMDHPIVTDHLTFGWFVFAVALVPFYWIANRGYVPNETEKVPVRAIKTVQMSSRNASMFGGLVVLIVLVPVVGGFFRSQAEPVNGSSQWLMSELNAQLGRPHASGSTKVKPNFVGASDIWQGHYQLNNRPLVGLIVRYDQQTQGQELIFIENSILDTDRWHPSDQVKAGESDEFSIKMWAGANNVQRVVVSWYIIGPFIASNEIMAKFYELLAFFRGDQTAYLVAIIMDRPETGDLEDIKASASKAIVEIRNFKMKTDQVEN